METIALPYTFFFRKRGVTESTIRIIIRILQPRQIGLDYTLNKTKDYTSENSYHNIGLYYTQTNA